MVMHRQVQGPRPQALESRAHAGNRKTETRALQAASSRERRQRALASRVSPGGAEGEAAGRGGAGGRWRRSRREGRGAVAHLHHLGWFGLFSCPGVGRKDDLTGTSAIGEVAKRRNRMRARPTRASVKGAPPPVLPAALPAKAQMRGAGGRPAPRARRERGRRRAARRPRCAAHMRSARTSLRAEPRSTAARAGSRRALTAGAPRTRARPPDLMPPRRGGRGCQRDGWRVRREALFRSAHARQDATKRTERELLATKAVRAAKRSAWGPRNRRPKAGSAEQGRKRKKRRDEAWERRRAPERREKEKN